MSTKTVRQMIDGAVVTIMAEMPQRIERRKFRIPRKTMDNTKYTAYNAGTYYGTKQQPQLRQVTQNVGEYEHTGWSKRFCLPEAVYCKSWITTPAAGVRPIVRSGARLRCLVNFQLFKCLQKIITLVVTKGALWRTIQSSEGPLDIISSPLFRSTLRSRMFG